MKKPFPEEKTVNAPKVHITPSNTRIVNSFHRDAVPLPQEGGSLINRFSFTHPGGEGIIEFIEGDCGGK